MKLKKRLKKLNPFKRIRAKREQLRAGDVIYTPLYGVWRHYGIVVEECKAGNHTVRTVHRNVSAPIEQPFDEFAAGKRVYRQSKAPGTTESAQNAQQETEFRYNLFLNNCENFVRRAEGKRDISLQVIAGIGTLAATIGLAIIRRRLPRI